MSGGGERRPFWGGRGGGECEILKCSWMELIWLGRLGLLKVLKSWLFEGFVY